MRALLSWLLPAAGWEVRRQGGSLEQPIQVNITSTDCNLNFRGRVSEMDLKRFEQETAAMPATHLDNDHPPCRGKEFSPTEKAIIGVLTREWMTKNEIADACKMPLSSQFCALLTNLVDREYLESGHKGYRLL